MVYAIISDVHANAIALSAVLEDARRCGAKKLLCLGDVVGYGPEPESTVSTIRARQPMYIMEHLVVHGLNLKYMFQKMHITLTYHLMNTNINEGKYLNIIGGNIKHLL